MNERQRSGLARFLKNAFKEKTIPMSTMHQASPTWPPHGNHNLLHPMVLHTNRAK